MNSSDVRHRLMKGLAGEAEARFVEDALARSELSDIEDVIVPYIKNYPKINENALLNYCEISRESFIISEIIKGLSYLGHESDRYENLLYEFSCGVDWDFSSELAISAVSCFPRAVPLSAKVVDALRDCYRRGNPILSDVAIEAVQSYLGVSTGEFVRGDGRGDLVHRVTNGVREWLLDHSFVPLNT